MGGHVKTVMLSLVMAVAFGFAAFAEQDTRTNLTFAVASIKPGSSHATAMSLRFSPSGLYTATNVSVGHLIITAYNLRNVHRLIGLPPWTQSAVFDISAKTEIENPTYAQLPALLQSLLADRFKLIVHHEVRELPVYALRVARAPGRWLFRTCDTGEIVTTARGVGRQSVGNRNIEWLASSITFDRFVVNETNLAGNFDWELDWTSELDAASDQPRIFSAFREQLGLKLEPDRAPVDVIIIDRLEHPTPD
jgi:uncharacterized protein (TIGR03435 family)